MKAVRSSSNECVISKTLNSPEMRIARENHAIPIFDFLDIGDWTIMVMPLWSGTFNPTPYLDHLSRLAMAQQLLEVRPFSR